MLKSSGEDDIVQLQYLKKGFTLLTCSSSDFQVEEKALKWVCCDRISAKHKSIEIVTATIKNASFLWQQQQNVAAAQEFWQ